MAAEFDQAPPAEGVAQYRFQKTDLSWSEWLGIAIPIEEEHVLSLQLSPSVTETERRGFFKQFTTGLATKSLRQVG